VVGRYLESKSTKRIEPFMRTFFRYTWLPLYRWWALRYIRKERVWRGAGLKLRVPPGVFHPGIYWSSSVFLHFVHRLDFPGENVLDVGTGSGLLALFAARRGGVVTAVDVNPAAVETARRNAALNNLSLEVLQSDLFDQLPPRLFRFILVNPPFYRREAATLVERAFFAGENLEYFRRFFREVRPFTGTRTLIYMVLSEDCDLTLIKQIATEEGFIEKKMYECRKWGEQMFVFLFVTRQMA
jgi:release factor glutamine methyltransferase